MISASRRFFLNSCRSLDRSRKSASNLLGLIPECTATTRTVTTMLPRHNARRSLSGFPRAALMVVAGSVLSDVMYGVFAFLGIAPFLRDAKVVGVFWSLNALILVVLALFALRSSASRETRTAFVPLSLHDRRTSFVVGFSLAVTNPLMIVWWLLGGKGPDGRGPHDATDAVALRFFPSRGRIGDRVVPDVADVRDISREAVSLGAGDAPHHRRIRSRAGRPRAVLRRQVLDGAHRKRIGANFRRQTGAESP